MSKRVYSVSDGGFKPQLLTVESHISNGLPSILIVGFANKAVDEAKERIRGAFSSAKLPLPRKRITLNLAPADIPKDSSSLDVAMAVSIMMESAMVSTPEDNTIYIGELGLNGIIRPVRGIIGKILSGKQHGSSIFCIPMDNLPQARLIPGIKLLPVSTLGDLYKHLSGTKPISLVTSSSGLDSATHQTPAEHDMSDIAGQSRAKRALEITAAGGHNILLNGAPGTGKSMLAKAFPGILPPMTTEETLEVTHIHSLTTHDYDKLITTRPLRAPHHSASQTAIVGGGQKAKPGEISLAHHGVLFMDEFPEYSRSTLEALRQPLEDKVIAVSRAQHHAVYPADFILIATSNPCPCGYYGTNKQCSCTAHQIVKYKQKLSGPILDRIDLYIDVDSIEHVKLLDTSENREKSSVVQKRVLHARDKQAKRNPASRTLNSLLSSRNIKKATLLSEQAEQLLNKAAQQLDISARSYMKIIKVARTIADLEGSQNIMPTHISEALQYRKPAKNY